MHQSPNAMVVMAVVYAWNILLRFHRNPGNTSSNHLIFPIMDIKASMLLSA